MPIKVGVGVVIILQEIVAAFTHFSLQLNVPNKTSPYSALIKRFLRLGGGVGGWLGELMLTLY